MFQHRCFPVAKFLRNTYLEEHLRTAASELTLRSDCLELCFWKIALKTTLTQYQSLSNQSFKHNSALMSSLYLTPTLPFERRFRMLIINGYYTKRVLTGVWIVAEDWDQAKNLEVGQIAKVYSESSQTSKRERFMKILNG